MSDIIETRMPATAVVTVDDGLLHYLTFSLGGRPYAVETQCVREILEFGSLTRVPMMPPVVRGVMNLRGAVVPVIDLQHRLGGGATEIHSRSCTVILEYIDAEGGVQIMGVIVDEVKEVLDVTLAQIRPPPAFGSHVRSEFMRGMVCRGETFVMLLIVDQVLDIQALAAQGHDFQSGSENADQLGRPVIVLPKEC